MEPRLPTPPGFHTMHGLAQTHKGKGALVSSSGQWGIPIPVPTGFHEG